MFAKCDKHFPSRSGQTSLATAVTNFTKPVGKINSGPSTTFFPPLLTGLRDQVRLRPEAPLRQAGREGPRQDRRRICQTGRGLPHGELCWVETGLNWLELE